MAPDSTKLAFTLNYWQWKTTQIRSIRWTRKHQELFDGHIANIMPVLVKGGMLEPLPASPDDNTPSSDSPKTTSWKTIPDRELSVFYTIYPDIRTAIDKLGASESTLAEAGLDQSVTLDLSPQSYKEYRSTQLPQRLGSSWPAYMQEKLLPDADYNPLAAKSTALTGIMRSGIGAHCLGILKKCQQAPGRPGGPVLRALGLARACGIRELQFFDFLELLANASVYEQIARNYYAAVLGVDNLSRFTHRLPNGEFLGNLKSTAAAFRVQEGCVQVGTIKDGKPVLTYPCPVEEMRDVSIKLARGTKAKGGQGGEGEPIYMATGLAKALAQRPENQKDRNLLKEFGLDMVREALPRSQRGKVNQSQAQVSRKDVHGNPCWQYKESQHIKLRVHRFDEEDDKRLYVKLSQLGEWLWDWSGAGIFGRPCGCNRPQNKKLIGHDNTGRTLERIPVSDRAIVSGYTDSEVIVFHEALQVHWSTDDLPLIVVNGCRFIESTYVQGQGECVYCALKGAAEWGCAMVIGGGV